MSLEILEKVKEFLVRLVKDQDFRTQLQTESIAGFRRVMQASGYNFSPEEFETATIKILELKELGVFHELSAEELVEVVGGYLEKRPTIQPMYGVVISPPPKACRKRCSRPIEPQPMYGVVIPIEPPINVQPLYGAIRATN